MPLSDETVRDLLFGDTDPRNLYLFMAQQGLSMDPVERFQRETILKAIETYTAQQMTAQTAVLSVETAKVAARTAKLAAWTFWLFLATAAIAVTAVVVAIFK